MGFLPGDGSAQFLPLPSLVQISALQREKEARLRAISLICVQARNAFSKQRILMDFSAGLQVGRLRAGGQEELPPGRASKALAVPLDTLGSLVEGGVLSRSAGKSGPRVVLCRKCPGELRGKKMVKKRWTRGTRLESSLRIWRFSRSALRSISSLVGSCSAMVNLKFSMTSETQVFPRDVFVQLFVRDLQKDLGTGSILYLGIVLWICLFRCHFN